MGKSAAVRSLHLGHYTGAVVWRSSHLILISHPAFVFSRKKEEEKNECLITRKCYPHFVPDNEWHIELIEVTNKGPMVNWVIDLNCLTEPEEQPKFKNPK